MVLSLILFITCSLTLSLNAKSLYGHDYFHENVNGGMTGLMNVLKSEFDFFKRTHNKIYKTSEEENRGFSNFVLSLIKIQEHNDLYERNQKMFKMGINHMTDWSSEDFDRLNKLKVINSSSTGSSLYLSPMVKVDLPESLDWRERGAVTEVKSQMNCGSCYAFSSTGSLEGQLWRKTGKLISLSEQQIVDCDNKDYGCDGGFMANVFKYIKDEGGIESEKDYPYVSGSTNEPNPKCYFKKDHVITTDTGFVHLPSGDEEKLKEALATVGPISIAISATSSLQNYESGIYHDVKCAKRPLNHGVLLVGYGTDKSSGIPYWIVKNSWGSNWGENGYFRLQRNINSCNMANYSLYPLV